MKPIKKKKIHKHAISGFCHRLFLFSLVCCPAIVAVGEEASGSIHGPTPSATGKHSFGSQSILESCWSAEVLQGKPSDKKIFRSRSKQDYSPPLVTKLEYSLEPLPRNRRNSIRYVRPAADRKIVALTFDLCEQANEVTGYQAELVNYLRRKGIKATFYAGGKWMRSHPEKAKQLMADPLFEIGNHAWTHGNLRVLKGQEMREQIAWTQIQFELLRKQLGDSACAVRAGSREMGRIPRVPATFRFPYGTCSREALDTLAEMGLPAIQWNIVTGDPAQNQTAKRIAGKVLRQLKPGSIIVAHANGRGWHTTEALELFIPQTMKRGYRFVTVSELLDAGEAVAADTCYEDRPGDNRHYDKLYGN